MSISTPEAVNAQIIPWLRKICCDRHRPDYADRIGGEQEIAQEPMRSRSAWLVMVTAGCTKADAERGDLWITPIKAKGPVDANNPADRIIEALRLWLPKSEPLFEGHWIAMWPSGRHHGQSELFEYVIERTPESVVPQTILDLGEGNPDFATETTLGELFGLQPLRKRRRVFRRSAARLY